MAALQALNYKPAVPVPAHQFADAALRDSWIQDKGMVVFQMRSDSHPETCVDIFVREPNGVCSTESSHRPLSVPPHRILQRLSENIQSLIKHRIRDSQRR